MYHDIAIILGDYDKEGHGDSETFFISADASVDDLQHYFTEGTDVLGFDITDSCKDYEDNSITMNQVRLLQDSGFDIDPEEFDSDDYDLDEDATPQSINIDTDLFLEIYLHTCRLGNPDLDIEVVDLPSMRIGGYGLFR